MRKSIISTLALASLASLMLLYPVGPADAKKAACLSKYYKCSSRCFNNNNPGDCVVRTCERQLSNCG